MSSDVGRVAAFIGAAGAAAQLAISLFNVADSFGAATGGGAVISKSLSTPATEISRIARDLSAFSQGLTAASKVVERRTGYDAALRGAAACLLNDCRRIVASDARSLLDQLVLLRNGAASSSSSSASSPPPSSSSSTSSSSSSSSTSPSAGQLLHHRISRLLNEPSVALLRIELESLRTSLALLVVAVDCADAFNRNAPEPVRWVYTPVEACSVGYHFLCDSN